LNKSGVKKMSIWQAFLEGKEAAKRGKVLADNPYVIGYTKLGAPKLSEEGRQWEYGFGSISRHATKKEIEAAAKVDVAQFGRKRKSYYNS
jgi:hypothetical protein